MANATGSLAADPLPDFVASTSRGRQGSESGPSAFTVDPDSNVMEAPNSSFSPEIRLKSGQSVEVDINVESAANFGLTFVAAPSVSVSLVDDRGSVAAKSLAGSTFAGALFRNLFVNRPVTGGVSKLRLQNTSDMEQVFVGYGWSIDGVAQ